ncbi:MAG: Cj0069 family protein [Acidobacteriota bacterium]|nr:Cj0069 family protein [Acidobacteriota bacterium]
MHRLKVGLLWRAEWDRPPPDAPIVEACRLREVFAAFSACGVPADPVIYSDDRIEEVRARLLGLDGVLVWVNPIEQGLDRSQLDPLLLEAADAGVWVSAHPEVIAKMATKQVLVDTRGMSWGTDTRLYRTASELRDALPGRLEERPALVLKRNRGMGGDGVWKVESDDRERGLLRVQHAVRGAAAETLSVDAFGARCDPYFAAGGLMVEQPFQARLAEGMIRVYLTHDRVVGFAHQYPQGLLGPADAAKAHAAKTFLPPSATAYRELRDRMESEWVPAMRDILDLDVRSLPVIWDADFLYGERTVSGEDTYVLCEINASSTFAFPPNAMHDVAHAAIRRMEEQRQL